jgi:hypothetical protein
VRTATPGAVGRLAGQDPLDAPDAFRVAGDVSAEEALAAARVVGSAAGAGVGMRGAQLALHLPEQVDELGVGTDPFDQRRVAVERALPVDAVHVRAPEVVAHQPPGLGVALPPLGDRVDLDRDPVEVDGDDLVALAAGAGLQAVLAVEDEPGTVAAHLEGARFLAELGLGALLEVVAFENGLGRRIGAVAELPGDGVAQPDQGVLGGTQVAIVRRGDGHRHHP